jgi:hypothetical protein
LQTPSNFWENLDAGHLACPNFTNVLNMSKVEKPIDLFFISYKEIDASRGLGKELEGRVGDLPSLGPPQINLVPLLKQRVRQAV